MTNGVQILVGVSPESAGTTIVAGTVPSEGAAASQARATVIAPAAPQQSGSPAQSPQEAAGPPSPRFQIGDQFTVKLVAPLAVSPAWQAVPAVAQALDGPIVGWQVIGSAAQGQDGSFQITWTQALSPDRNATIALHGVAYDSKVGKPGVPGASSTVMAPAAARTALAGSLGAVSQYVQDQINSSLTQVSGITATITSQVPPFWQILAQQLATGFQPAPVQTGGTILVNRAEAGTLMVVFITAASQ